MARPHIVLATRELYPFAAGGIAPVTAALARALSEVADVTIVTTDRHREAYEALRAEGPVYGEGVVVEFAEEPSPGAHGDYYSYMHNWSARLFEHLLESMAEKPPDLIEFCDYLAEGFVTIQARHAGDPFLAGTEVAVRLHTSGELCSVLNAGLRDDLETEAVWEAERFSLRHADHILHPGGDVFETYRRYYGSDALAPGVKVLDAFFTDYEPVPEDAAPSGEGPGLRVLYLGRLERRKGVQNLLRATALIGNPDFRLTLLGGDTDTAPLLTSMAGQLELQSAGDERVVFAEAVPRNEVGAMIAQHDVVVMPSLWECWPNVAREAFMHNRPVLATPVGGLCEMVVEGQSGWLTRDTSVQALFESLEALIADPGQARDLVRDGGPRRRYEELVDADRTRRGYLDLIESRAATTPALRSTRRPLVSIVVPYYQMEAHVRATIESIAAQSYPHIETLLVNDGSFRGEDFIVEGLVEEFGFTVLMQPNSGLSAARNFGVSQARGRYVLPLDPDNVIEPDFVERCVDVLEANEDHAYVTTWSRYIDEFGEELGPGRGYAPYGNWTALIDRENVAGDGTAMLRRRLFDMGFSYNVDLTSFEDWFLYRELHHAGHHGAVIPRRLFQYRVRRDSMLRSYGMANTQLLHDEMRALLKENETQWTHQSA